MNFGKRVIYRFSNHFGEFTIEEQIYEGRQSRVLFSGPQHAAQSGIPLDTNPKLLFDYNQRLLELALDIKPRSMLILGGGTLTLASAIVKQLPRVHLTVVEQNQDLIDLAARFFEFRPNKRLELAVTDASEFLKKTKDKYDYIAMDLYDNFAIPSPFLTSSFAHLVRKSLKPNGVVAANCISGIAGEWAKPLIKLSTAFRSELGAVKVVKADNRYSLILPMNLIVISAIEEKRMSSLLKDADIVDSYS